jgi:2-iminobutanoate/2-iminopropanoate deaminase
MSEPLLRTPGQSPLLPGTVTAGGFVFTSGLVSPTAFASMSTGQEVEAETQIAEALDLLRINLETAGTSLDRAVRIEAFLSSSSLLPAWNAQFEMVWPTPGPARTTLVVAFTSPVIHFELQAIATL